MKLSLARPIHSISAKAPRNNPTNRIETIPRGFVTSDIERPPITEGHKIPLSHIKVNGSLQRAIERLEMIEIFLRAAARLVRLGVVDVVFAHP